MSMSASGSRIVTAVSGVNDNGIKGTDRLAYLLRSHDGIKQFDKVGSVDEMGALIGFNREGENKFDLIH